MQTRALKVSAYGAPNANNDSFFANYDFFNVTALFKLASGASLRITERRERSWEIAFKQLRLYSCVGDLMF